MKRIYPISFLLYWISFNVLLTVAKSYVKSELPMLVNIILIFAAIVIAVIAFRKNRQYTRQLAAEGKSQGKVSLWVILLILGGVCINAWGIWFGQRTH